MLMVKQSVAAIALLFTQYSYANGIPTAPTNVNASRTSDSTVFISWTRSTDDVAVTGYNVYRDDKYISTVTNPRLADVLLAPDVNYQYYVVAYDAQGNFSPRSAIGSTGDSAPAEPTSAHAHAPAPAPAPANNTAASPPSEITVANGRITWPNNGYYQVQQQLASGEISNICEGTSFCDVTGGTFIVINHTTGARNTVNVGSASNAATSSPQAEANNTTSNGSTTGNNSSAASAVTVTNGRINLPNDGWYQVQQTQANGNIIDLCNGERFCDVSAGTYTVINHTTGLRSLISVAGSTTTSLPSNPVVSNPVASAPVHINAANALERWADYAAVIREERLNAFFASVEADNVVEINFLESVNVSFPTSINGVEFSQESTANPPYQFVVRPSANIREITEEDIYTCAGGGRILTYGFLGFDNQFESCVVGSAEYNGTAAARDLGRATIERYPFTNFSRMNSDGTEQNVNGEAFSGNEALASFTNSSRGWRNLSFNSTADNFALSNYSLERTQFDNSQVYLGATVLVNGSTERVVNYRVSRDINGQFDVILPPNLDQTINVAVDLEYRDTATVGADDPNLDYPGRDTELPFEWQTGSVAITATDGSSMTITPVEGNQFQIELGTGEIVGPVLWSGIYEL